ncbi:unnamed protein product, partial [Polarella glacialis]
MGLPSPCQAVIPKCQRLHGSLKRSSAKLLRDWARAKHLVREALRQAPATVPDEFEPTAEGLRRLGHQIYPTGSIHHRLYRQHALPWGPIFVKDMSKLGRNLDTTPMIDNVQENFMLQPNHGIFIYAWYDDPEDTALYALTPLLDELITTRSKVQDILEKYRDQIPAWVPPSAMGSYQPLESTMNLSYGSVAGRRAYR